MTASPVEFELRTSRYANREIADNDLVAVGITAGRPRFRLAFEVAANLKVLAPERAWFPLPSEEFDRLYVQKLAAVGVDAINRKLRECFEAHRRRDDRGIALLCFENVLAGEQCHRRTFARWYEKQTGQQVDELEHSVNAITARLAKGGANDG